MSFMKPVIESIDKDIIESMYNVEHSSEHGFESYLETTVSQGYKYAWRLSAPGYMDCTDWSPAKDTIDAALQIMAIHGDEFDLEDFRTLGAYLDGFEEFVASYLLGLAFTASDSTGEPLFNHPGQDISDVVCPDTDVFNKLSSDDQEKVMYDCLHFLTQALNGHLLGGNASAAGSDFHLTRNGHGAGFWDGDWPVHGTKLTDLSKTFGSAELYLEDGKLGIE